MSEEQKTQLYWIAQEAVTNARKYADADEIRIRLRATSDGLRLLIEDDGDGFNPSREEGGLGLRSMKYHSELVTGTFSFDSAPGEGTQIGCRVYPPMY
ncbi:MAG: ATP-binding protein [Salinivenus sp.]